MTWIAKPSATTKIPTRAEPYLTPAMRDRYERELLPRYAERKGALMMILHDLQHDHHCIPWQAMLELASFLKITPAEVLDTVSFYDEYTLEPTGKCVIGVCHSIACEMCGGEGVIAAVTDRLGIESHQTTADGTFTLLRLECLGACDGAPVALVNGTLHERLSPASVNRIIDEAGAGGGGRH